MMMAAAKYTGGAYTKSFCSKVHIIKTAIDFHYMLNMWQMCVKYERSKKLHFFPLDVLQAKFSLFSLEILFAFRVRAPFRYFFLQAKEKILFMLESNQEGATREIC
jgi:hypothetical protein